jgi:deoxyribodipyrimidine photo-lyase
MDHLPATAPAPLSKALFWFRRDLRARDNAGLYHALRNARQVWCVFVLDRDILDALPRKDRRVEFIVDSLLALDAELRALHPQAGLIVRHASSMEAIADIAKALQVQAVYANHDDEPQALARDQQVRGQLAHIGIALHTSKDHVVFERSEILTGGGTPYGVFTPYKNAWLKKIQTHGPAACPVDQHAAHLAALPETLCSAMPTLQAIGFESTNLHTLQLGQGGAGAQ